MQLRINAFLFVTLAVMAASVLADNTRDAAISPESHLGMEKRQKPCPNGWSRRRGQGNCHPIDNDSNYDDCELACITYPKGNPETKQPEICYMEDWKLLTDWIGASGSGTRFSDVKSVSYANINEEVSFRMEVEPDGHMKIQDFYAGPKTKGVRRFAFGYKVDGNTWWYYGKSQTECRHSGFPNYNGWTHSKVVFRPDVGVGS